MNICIDCEKKIKGFGKRCYSCANTGKNNPMFGKIGINNPNYIDGRTLKQYYCSNCNKKINYNTVIYGTGKCLSCIRKEEYINPNKHPQWLGGLSYLPYTLEFNNQLKREIRDRDNHECQLCHTIEEILNQLLDIHHIDYNKANCLKKNLISLCRKCNIKVNADRDYWFAYFTYIMENKCYE